MTFAPDAVSWLMATQAAATFAMTGVIWLVQMVQYPAFRQVGAAEFGPFHQHHCRAIGYVVGPLMLIELFTAVLLAWSGQPLWFWRSMLGVLVLVWLSTGLVQGPLHSRLAREGPRADLLDSLVRGNWLRTVAWTARSAGLVWFYARGWALS
ncbi:MAG: hypothetical protein ACKOKC_13345 [Chthoniobacterales bacterium]